MKKFIVETYYTCTFKTVHVLNELNDSELSKIDSRKDGEVEVIEVKLNNRKTRKIGSKNKQETKSKNTKTKRNKNKNHFLLHESNIIRKYTILCIIISKTPKISITTGSTTEVKMPIWS